jgi:hypothetical protein
LSTFADWNRNSIGDTGPLYVTSDGVPVQSGPGVRGAFRVLGTPTSPTLEPTTLAAATLGALALAGYGRRRRARAAGR